MQGKMGCAFSRSARSSSSPSPPEVSRKRSESSASDENGVDVVLATEGVAKKEARLTYAAPSVSSVPMGRVGGRVGDD